MTYFFEVFTESENRKTILAQWQAQCYQFLQVMIWLMHETNYGKKSREIWKILRCLMPVLWQLKIYVARCGPRFYLLVSNNRDIKIQMIIFSKFLKYRAIVLKLRCLALQSHIFPFYLPRICLLQCAIVSAGQKWGWGAWKARNGGLRQRNTKHTFSVFPPYTSSSIIFNHLSLWISLGFSISHTISYHDKPSNSDAILRRRFSKRVFSSLSIPYIAPCLFTILILFCF